MVSALYRRYRPETFSELIGQSHVTDPLMAALRSDRVNHAYLFSGPRGCGKTTSARILARCLNCAKGPTDTPCGECPSCVELGREGGGSIDVIEIDAASHGGVDDARDLRERATLAPNRDRFKIYIIDEAHMVSKDGFNALLKIVEEPPEHVKFIFATTEPEKVIGTIRSRTHHYPFRLIPPALLLDYVTELSQQEAVEAEPGVLPLVIRGGGGSARDTLSLLDQLMAGSEGAITYARAVSLLGFTHSELLDDVTAALAAKDSQAAFGAVERVMQTGQDPRRFVEDLLEHLRDLIITAVTEDAESILHGVQTEEIERMRDRAHDFGPLALSHAADTVAKSLSAMTGATSPKLQLELLLARLLVTGDGVAAAQRDARPRPQGRTAAPAQEAGGSTAPSAPAPKEPGRHEAVPSEQSAPAVSAPEPTAPQQEGTSAANAADSRPDLAAAAASFRASAPAPSEPEPESSAPDATAPSAPEQSGPAQNEEARSEPAAQSAPAQSDPAQSDPAPSASAPSAPEPMSGGGDRASSPAPSDEPEPQPEAPQETAPPSSESTDEPSDDVSEAGPIAFAQIEDAWPEVLSALEGKSRRAWMVASAIRPVDFDADSNKIGLTFRSPGDMNEFRSGRDGDEAIWKIIRSALEQRFGQQFGFAPREGAAPRQSETGAAAATGSGAQEAVPEPSPPDHFDDEPPEPEPPYEPSMGESAPQESSRQPAPSAAPTSSGGGWAVAEIPQSEPDKDTDSVIDPWAESATPNATVTVDERHDSKAAASKLPAAMRDAPPPQEPQELSATESARYGEAVIREELGAEFLEELTDEGGR